MAVGSSCPVSVTKALSRHVIDVMMQHSDWNSHASSVSCAFARYGYLSPFMNLQ